MEPLLRASKQAVFNNSLQYEFFCVHSKVGSPLKQMLSFVSDVHGQPPASPAVRDVVQQELLFFATLAVFQARHEIFACRQLPMARVYS